MQVTLHEFQLPLRHPFTISRESHTVQPTLIVELREAGVSGYGEATTNPYYRVSLESLRASVQATCDLLAQRSVAGDGFAPETLWAELHERLPSDPFALCAIDQAVHDLWGKLLGQPVYRLWGFSLDQQLPLSCFTIGIDDVAIMRAKLRETSGWPIYKIKLGTDRDVQIVRKLRQETDAVFRVDANCGWSVTETLRNAEQLRELGVEFIEQPLAADDVAGYKMLFQQSCLPIMADESCQVESDVRRCAERFHAINIKLVKCGGLSPARRMIAEAHELDLQVMVGCMTESTVGISAIAQLLPLLDYVDMDGAALLAQDIAEGVQVEHGVAMFPDRPGHGVRLLPPRK